MQKLLELLPDLGVKLRRYFIDYRFDFRVFINTFPRFLGLIYLISFSSILYQFPDLYGPYGIDKISPEYLARIVDFQFINLFSIFSTSSLIIFLWLGVIASIILIIGWFPFWTVLLNSIIYLSLVSQSANFMRFQWDIFLIEVSFLSLFFMPTNFKRLCFSRSYSGYFLQLLPVIFLLIRLFFQSGMVKLYSKDFLWLSYSVLDVHLYSQPLPHILSYYFHSFVSAFNLSEFFTFFMFIIEIFVPFGLLFRSYRSISASLLIILQVSILLTGNYGFFNFIVIAALVPFLFLTDINPIIERKKFHLNWFVIPLAVIISVYSAVIIFPKQTFFGDSYKIFFRRLSIMNSYGLFARMTTNQTKYNVSLSHDLKHWVPVHLKYFDEQGFPDLSFVQPYHPRIRWQLWFKFIYLHMYPKWYQSFYMQLAKDPLLFSSIVKQNQTFDKHYHYVRLCYQNVVFDHDNDISDGSKYWTVVSDQKCHIVDAFSGKIDFNFSQ